MLDFFLFLLIFFFGGGGGRGRSFDKHVQEFG